MRNAHYSHKKPNKFKHRTVVLATVLIAAVAAAAVGTGILLFSRNSSSPAASSSASGSVKNQVFGNVEIDSVSLKGMTLSKARSAVVSYVEKKDAGRSYTLTHGEDAYKLNGKDLHISYNINATLQKALSESAASSAEQTKKYTLTPAVDQSTLKTRLSELTAPVNKAAKEPTIQSFDGSNFTFTNGTPGTTVNLSALLTDTVKAVTASDSASIPIQTTETACKRTAADLQGKIVKLGSFTTESHNTENGTFNMAKALETVNGTVLEPDGVFSYLGIVGSADKDSGYKLAGALENGVSVQSYGGGICQGSTTIYGAALRSNCKIVERSPHSSPSSYVPIGLDATVSYPDLDFKFQNPTQYPMYIQSGADGTTMYCNIYGYNDGSWDKIEAASEETGSVPPPADVIKVDKSKSAGYREQTVTALTGHYASSSRVFYKNGKVVKTETMSNSYYPPRAAVYVVGASAPASSAPAASKKPAASSSSAASSSAASSAVSSKPAA